jgi:CxxC-x17-CxxC domain-containing protein
MYDSNKKSRFGGKRKSFGDRDGGRPAGRSAGPMTLHDAICAECSKECKVPFKPNGKKPVYCVDCFKQMEGAGDREDRGRERGGFDRRPSFGMRPSNDGIAELNRKVDRILRILEDTE